MFCNVLKKYEIRTLYFLQTRNRIKIRLKMNLNFKKLYYFYTLFFNLRYSVLKR